MPISACLMKEGMSTPRFIPSKWIKIDKDSSVADKLRPNVDGKLVLPKEDKPTITVKLVDSGNDGIPVGKIEVNGNFDKFTVEYKEKAKPNVPFKPLTFLNDDKPQVSVCNQTYVLIGNRSNKAELDDKFLSLYIDY